MTDLPLWAQITALVVLLLISGFFSISETSMMALNRYRLRHMVAEGRRAAKRTQALLNQTDRLLGVILLGNNLVNALATALVTSIAIASFGNNETALLLATGAITFLIIVFSELTPKVIGATFPERIALPASLVLSPLLKLASPAVSFVNFFATGLLRLMRIKPGGHEEQRRLTPEELRSIVLESTPFFPQKHRSILLNLFDLDAIQVDDVMTPRAKVESLDLLQPLEALREQLATCHHNKLPVYEGELNRVKGMLHVRRVLALLEGDDEHFTHEALRNLLTEAYFIPQGTPVFEQLQHFQETKQRIGLVVDEYGEVQGLVTLEDIIEEIIGEFTTHMPGAPRQGLRWNQAGEVIVDGSVALRELNKALDLELPIDGPKTLNGLLLEWLQEIPDSPVAMRQQGVIAEALQIEDRIIKTVRLRRDDK